MDPRGGSATVLLALGLTLACALLAAGTGAEEDPAPASLARGARDLQTGLEQLAEAEDLEQARQLHSEHVQPAAGELSGYLEDLAGDDGRLLASYLERTQASLAEGELSDARSLAGAGANLLGDEIVPVAERWDVNRTFVLAGPLQTDSRGLVVPLVLVNPPPAGVAAYDVSLSFPDAQPQDATVEVGRGEVHVDEANATVRWASFDASSMARLGSPGAERVLLGEAILDPGDLEPGDELAVDAQANELLDPEGDPVPAVGSDNQRTVPEPETGLDQTWVALGGVGVAALGFGWWVNRWEV